MWMWILLACEIPSETFPGRPGIQIGAEGDDPPCTTVEREVDDLDTPQGSLLEPPQWLLDQIAPASGDLTLADGEVRSMSQQFRATSPVRFRTLQGDPKYDCNQESYVVSIQGRLEAEGGISIPFDAQLVGQGFDRPAWFGLGWAADVQGLEPPDPEPTLVLLSASRGTREWTGSAAWEAFDEAGISTEVVALGQWSAR